MKICVVCKKEKRDDEYYANPKTKDRLGSHCKECHRVYSHDYYKRRRGSFGDDKWREKSREIMRRWRANNLEKARAKSRFYREKYRDKYNESRRKKLADIVKSVIEKYGGVCICCGEKNWKFLSLDHINGNGNKHRKLEGISSLSLWAAKNNYPDILQVLCFNCNFARQARGGKESTCPHKLSV